MVGKSITSLVLSFIFFWATLETLQAMHRVPDYTYDACWTKKLSPGSKASTATQYFDRNRTDTYCTSPRGRFIPASQKGVPCGSPQALGGVRTGEEVMEESFVGATVETFKHLLTKYVQQFKGEKVINGDYYKPASGSLHSVPVFDRVREKITFVREFYDWENEATRELASYLLERFPSLLLPGDLIRRVNKKMEEESKKKVDEALFFQAMEETFLAIATVTLDNLIKRDAQQFK